LNVSHGISREYGGLRIAKAVAGQKLITDLANRADAFLAYVLEVIEAFL
jgi:hypothetical protein